MHRQLAEIDDGLRMFHPDPVRNRLVELLAVVERKFPVPLAHQCGHRITRFFTLGIELPQAGYRRLRPLIENGENCFRIENMRHDIAPV